MDKFNSTHSQQEQYLERFQVDLLHCQPAIFCEELHMREKAHQDQKTEITVTDFGGTFFLEEKKLRKPADAAGRPPGCSGRDCTPENET